MYTTVLSVLPNNNTVINRATAVNGSNRTVQQQAHPYQPLALEGKSQADVCIYTLKTFIPSCGKMLKDFQAKRHHVSYTSHRITQQGLNN